MATAAPRVTVFIPVFDRAAMVGDAIRSVLAQDFRDFELVVIDDGSTDGSGDVVRSFRDPRIRLVTHAANLGIPVTRNHGLDLARGEYVALLDSDDVAGRGRLRAQVDALDRRPEIGVLGSWWTSQRDGGRRRPLGIMPVTPDDVRAHLLFRCALSQSTIMARTAILRAARYPEESPVSSDFALWVRLAPEIGLANVPRFLVHRRMHARRITYEAATIVKTTKQRIFASELRALGVPFTDDDLDRHFLLLHVRTGCGGAPPGFAAWASTWLATLADANRARRVYEPRTFARVLTEVWLAVCFQCAADPTQHVWRAFRSSPLGRGLPAVLAHHAATMLFRRW